MVILVVIGGTIYFTSGVAAPLLAPIIAPMVEGFTEQQILALGTQLASGVFMTGTMYVGARALGDLGNRYASDVSDYRNAALVGSAVGLTFSAASALAQGTGILAHAGIGMTAGTYTSILRQEVLEGKVDASMVLKEAALSGLMFAIAGLLENRGELQEKYREWQGERREKRLERLIAKATNAMREQGQKISFLGEGWMAVETKTLKLIECVLDQYEVTKDEFILLAQKASSELTATEAELMANIRNVIPMPDKYTWLQKVINPKYIEGYLDGSFTKYGEGRISGCITTVDGAAGLKTPQVIYNAMRMDYPNSPFSIGDGSVTVIRFTSSEAGNIVIPYGNGMPNPVGGAVANMKPPFTGTGFTSSLNGHIVPEFYSNGLSLNHGALMYEITSDGKEILKAIFDNHQMKFVLVN